MTSFELPTILKSKLKPEKSTDRRRWAQCTAALILCACLLNCTGKAGNPDGIDPGNDYNADELGFIPAGEVESAGAPLMANIKSPELAKLDEAKLMSMAADEAISDGRLPREVDFPKSSQNEPVPPLQTSQEPELSPAMKQFLSENGPTLLDETAGGEQ